MNISNFAWYPYASLFHLAISFFALRSVRSIDLTGGEYTRYAPMAPGKERRPTLHRLQTHRQLRKKRDG